MLGIVSMAGNALKAFGNTHPAVKWGVIVLAFLLAAEFVAKEGVSLWVQVQNAPAIVEKTKADAKTAKTEAHAKSKPLFLQLPDDATAADVKAQGDAEQAKAQGDAMRHRPNIFNRADSGAKEGQ